jgi:hypothetical protein
MPLLLASASTSGQFLGEITFDNVTALAPNSVVNWDVPSHAKFAGMPAKKVSVNAAFGSISFSSSQAEVDKRNERIVRDGRFFSLSLPSKLQPWRKHSLAPMTRDTKPSITHIYFAIRGRAAPQNIKAGGFSQVQGCTSRWLERGVHFHVTMPCAPDELVDPSGSQWRDISPS